MKEQMQTVAFQIIAEVGTAKSMFMEALSLAKEGKLEESKQMMAEGEELFSGAHKHHFDIIQKEAAGEDLPFSVIFMHAEDQLLTTELLKTLVVELIELNTKK